MNSIINKKSLIYFRVIVATFIIVFGISSCNHYDEIQNSGIESSQDEDSHNSGLDCMKCHHDNSNEASEKWFYIAGTAYKSNGTSLAKSGKVQLWTGANSTGTLLHTLEIDKNGNFYTEKIIDFKGGYFPVIISQGDTTMLEKVTGDNLNRSCNGCHGHNGNGKSTPPIAIK